MYFEYFLVTILILLIFLRLRKKIVKYKSIYSKNGLLASPDSKNSITEVFRKENVPKTFSKENKISKSKEEELELEKLF